MDPIRQPTKKLLKLAEVTRMLNISRSSLYKWMEEGSFPRPIKLGITACRWHRQDVETWLDTRRSSH